MASKPHWEAQQFDFPSAVLAHILSYVQTRQRISSCACVSPLTSLRHLHLSSVAAGAPQLPAAAAALPPADYADADSCGLGGSLRALTHLTRLDLHCQLLQPGDLAALSSLQQLQHLQLCFCPGLDANSSVFAALPGSLTALRVTNVTSGQQLTLTNEAMPGMFAGLTRLQHLDLVNVVRLEAALLSHLTGLTSLKLEHEAEDDDDDFW
ncbi:hypothetical protein OEZ86_010727 [Tetradesmus obliquus]|nr:hypothetical protein OEZ86_010727 [Tetradesmus obliquus]